MSQCRIKGCTSNTVANSDLCNKHYWHYVWYSVDFVYQEDEHGEYIVDDHNFPYFDIPKCTVGMATFAQMVFPDLILKQYGLSDMHKLLILTILEATARDAKDITYVRRSAAIQCFRGFAKSTWVTNVTPAYAILSHFIPDDLFDKDSQSYQLVKRLQIVSEFIVVIMETGDMANSAVEFQHEALLGNEFISNYFGSVKSSKSSLRVNEKFNEQQILTTKLPTGKQCRILGKGSGQRFRGMRSLNVRPRLIIFDDVESEDNTGTPEARLKLTKWASRTVLNTLDVPNSAVFYVGTALGMDTILYRALQGKNNRKVQIDLLTEPSLTTGKPVWPQRFPMPIVMDLYEKACEQGDEAGFWQEYFGIVAKDDEKPLPRDTVKFYDGDYILIDGIQCIKIYAIYKFNEKLNNYIRQNLTEPLIEPITVGIGIDIAISERTKADKSVIATEFQTSSNKILLHEINSGRYGEADVLYDEYRDIDRKEAYVVETDLRKIKRHGVPEEVVRTIFNYDKVHLVCIETYALQKSYSNMLHAYFRKNDISTAIVEFNKIADKVTKVKNSLATPWQQGRVYFHKRYIDHPIFRQFINFGLINEDDSVDAVTLITGELRSPNNRTQIDKVESKSHISPAVKELMPVDKEPQQTSMEERLNLLWENIQGAVFNEL